MAVRTPIPFYTAFEAAVRPTGLLTTMASSAELKAQLLQAFNRTYRIGYDLPTLSGNTWEDARSGSMITPTAGLITYDQIGEARQFEVWDMDRRYNADAEKVYFWTDTTGIRVSEDSSDAVWVEWTPVTVKFSYTAWVTATAYVVGDVAMITSTGNCYRCLVAHTSGTFATDLAASKWVLMPVLAVLEEFLICHMQATHLKESQGQPDTGFKLQAAAVADLTRVMQAELRRIQASVT